MVTKIVLKESAFYLKTNRNSDGCIMAECGDVDPVADKEVVESKPLFYSLIGYYPN